MWAWFKRNEDWIYAITKLLFYLLVWYGLYLFFNAIYQAALAIPEIAAKCGV